MLEAGIVAPPGPVSALALRLTLVKPPAGACTTTCVSTVSPRAPERLMEEVVPGTSACPTRLRLGGTHTGNAVGLVTVSVAGLGWGGRCVGGRGRSADGDAVLRPRVAQWGSACCSDTEGRRLACRYGLASWLRGNRWRHRGRIDREGGCAAGNTTHRIANYDCEQRAIV